MGLVIFDLRIDALHGMWCHCESSVLITTLVLKQKVPLDLISFSRQLYLAKAILPFVLHALPPSPDSVYHASPAR